MAEQSTQLVQKLWNYSTFCAMTGCRTAIILRQAQDRLPQLTFLLFLKMADEQCRPPFNKVSPIPKNVD
jgi:type I restriction enzyme M protein